MSNRACPTHGAVLQKKRIVWGLVNPKDLSPDIIPGGCCPPPSPDCPHWGYVCPMDEKVYVLQDGSLVPWSDEDEADG